MRHKDGYERLTCLTGVSPGWPCAFTHIEQSGYMLLPSRLYNLIRYKKTRRGVDCASRQAYNVRHGALRGRAMSLGQHGPTTPASMGLAGHNDLCIHGAAQGRAVAWPITD